MNKIVKERMFTFELHVFKMCGASSLGDKTTKVITLNCYLKEEMKIVTDSLGKEVSSSAQVYLVGEDMSQIDSKDTVTVGILQNKKDDQDKEILTFVPILSDKQIIRRDVFYKPNSQPDVGVIYLP